VHQTTAGKMIFGRCDDRSEVAPRAAAAAVGMASSPEPRSSDRPARPLVPETNRSGS
jgi:hypothetical protein